MEKELERLSNEYAGPQPTQADRDAFLRECEEYEASNTNNTAVEIDELTKKSKKLGNWRTGLLAGNTATNIAMKYPVNNTPANKTDVIRNTFILYFHTPKTIELTILVIQYANNNTINICKLYGRINKVSDIPPTIKEKQNNVVNIASISSL